MKIAGLLILSFIIAGAIVALNLLLGFNMKRDLEKLSPYECGFNPFSESRHKFEVKFYLVSLIFLIFDLEVLYLFPFSKELTYLSSVQFFSGLFFIFLIGLGILYEIRKKSIAF